MLGKELIKEIRSKKARRCLKVLVLDSVETAEGRKFHTRAAVIGKARPPMVGRHTRDTMIVVVKAVRSLERPAWSDMDLSSLAR